MAYHYLHVVILFGCAFAVTTEVHSNEGYPWTSYIGSHYRQHSWARSIRDYAGPKSAGITFPLEKHITNGVSFEALHGIDAVIMNIGGLGSGRQNSALAAFMSAVEKDEGQAWRKAVRQRVTEYARMENALGPQLYWQFGNEINSEQFSRAFHLWAADGAIIKANDPSTITWYVEYYLAPGLMAIAEAEHELMLPENSIRVVLGSLAAARNPNSQHWLDMLLEYRIKGDYAQDLKGKYVWEVVNIVAMHYLVGTPGSQWEEILECFHDKWIKSGRIRGLWSTEELGIRKARSGYGAGTAIKVWARYLDWWMKKNISPEQGKVFFWGSEIGEKSTNADGILEELYRFLGNTPLYEMDSKVLNGGDGEIEYYRYGSVMEPNKMVIIVFPREHTGGSISLVPISSVGQCDDVKIVSLFLGPEGSINRTLVGDQLDGKMVVKFDKPLQLLYATAAVFFIESNDMNCNWSQLMDAS